MSGSGQSATKRKLAMWQALPHEKKVKALQRLLAWVEKEAKEKGPRVAGLKLMRFLLTEDGAIVWPWLWRAEYREKMINITYDMIELALKLLASQEQSKAKTAQTSHSAQ